MVAFGLDLQMPRVDFHQGVDHGVIAAELKREHKHEKQTGKGDSHHGQDGPTGIPPDVAPGHFGIHVNHMGDHR